MKVNFLALFLIVSLSFFSCNPTLYSGNDESLIPASLAKDEGPHASNSMEWWYYTGHLYDEVEDRELGIELVFFHFTPTKLKSYLLVNMAVSDPESEAFYYDYQLIPIKGELKKGLPLDLELDKDATASIVGHSGKYELKASMDRHDVEFSLTSISNTEVVFHDETGYKNYGDKARAGYLSFPSLKTKGSIRIKNQDYSVKGELWYDRQWNCSGVTNTESAWDWFSVQFEESKSQLMLYRLYEIKGNDQILGGTYIDSLGKVVELKEDEINIKELGHWKSHQSHAYYPIAWEVNIPKLKLKTRITARMPNQELKLKFSLFKTFYYWEGMCEAFGEIDGSEVWGKSYVEMTNRYLKGNKKPKNLD